MFYVDQIRALVDAGRASQLLLSHDRGWYDPAQPKGGLPKPYTHLGAVLMPRLIAAGIPEPTLRALVWDNPLAAFGR